jgi:hypothetical protein
VARQQPKNVLRSMVKVAELVEQHLAGILAHWKWGVTNAFMEGRGYKVFCVSGQASERINDYGHN